MIDLAHVRVVGASRRILDFPITARLSGWGWDRNAMFIRSDGADHWPAVPVEPGGEPAQAATLWVFLNIGGIWFATGAERLRPNQVNGSKPEGSPATLIGEDWLYDPNRWKEMAGYNPVPGEHVGVMIAAGSTRSDDNTPVQERSNILVIAWPDALGQNPCTVVWTEGQPTPVPGPEPPPAPAPTPAPVPVPAPAPPCDLSAVLDQLAAIQETQKEQGLVLAKIAHSVSTRPAYVGRLSMNLRLTPE